MAQTAVYPGSFDPVTNGHLDLIERARHIFSEVFVAVAVNIHKEALFSVEERVEMLQECTAGMDGVKVEAFDGLVVDYAGRKDSKVLIRGLRMFSDFEYEFQMALTNRRFNGEVETVFLMPSEDNSFLSSTLLKEAAALGGDVSCFVPKSVEQRLVEKLKKSKKR